MRATSYLNLNFSGISVEERIEQAAAAGVDGIEWYGWDLGIEEVERVGGLFDEMDVDIDAITQHAEAHGLDLVYMSGDRPALTDPSVEGRAIESIERSIELADRIGCPFVNVKAGPVQAGSTRAAQRHQVINTLRTVAPVVEASGSTLVLEPINPIDAPMELLQTAAEAFTVIDAVGSPSIKLLFDIYHEQLASGNVTRTIERLGNDAIAHVHAADAPDRSQPGTGELAWTHVIGVLKETGYDGFLGGEFIPTGDPDAALGSFADLAHAG